MNPKFNNNHINELSNNHLYHRPILRNPRITIYNCTSKITAFFCSKKKHYL